MSQIIDGSNKPKKTFKFNKKIAIGIALSLLAVSIVTVGFLFFKPNNNQQDASSDPVYQQMRDSMKNKGITYTEDDYNKDKKIIEESTDKDGNLKISEENKANLSNAYQQSLSANDKALQAANELTGTNVSSTDDVQSYIVDKVNKMTAFINTDYGWPTSDYDDTYDTFRDYIHQLDKYASYGTDMENWYDGQFTLDYQATILRYSAFTQEQYTISNNSATGHESLLKNWYVAGHPNFGRIYDYSLEQNDIEFDDGTISNLQARIVTDNGAYLLYLKAYNSDSDSFYELIDIKQL